MFPIQGGATGKLAILHEKNKSRKEDKIFSFEASFTKTFEFEHLSSILEFG